MTSTRFCFAPLLATLLAAPAVAQTSQADTPNKDKYCAELFALMNSGGQKPTTDAEKLLFQDLREWGEIVALREDLRRARRWLADPQYDPRGQSLLTAIVMTRFHADGKTWEDLRGDVARLDELFAAKEPDRSKVEGLCETLQARLEQVQKPVYARLQAQQLPGAASGQPGDDEKKFLAAVLQQLKEMYDDARPMTAHERHLVVSMRRLEGRRLTARRAAFWLAGYRAAEMKSRSVPSRPAVLVCFPEGATRCKMLKQKLSCCAESPVEVTVVEITSVKMNRWKEEIARTMDGKPDGTPVFLVGHGFRAPLRQGGETVEELTKREKVHFFDTGSDDASLRIPKGIPGQEVIDALFTGSRRPAVWVTSSFSGLLCTREGIGGSCQKDEKDFTLYREAYLDRATAALADLYGKRSEFEKADVQPKDGELSAAEFSKYLCEHALGGRPSMEIIPRTMDEANLKNLRDLVDLMIADREGYIDAEGRQRMARLREENDGPPGTKDPKFADLSNYDYGLRLSNYLPYYKGVPLKGRTRWRTVETVDKEGQRGSVLVLEFPCLDSTPTIWIDGKNPRTFHPHVTNFKLRFDPTSSQLSTPQRRR
jgi:hypothetical protein